MRKNILAISFLVLSAGCFGQLKNGYEIALTISGLQDSSIYLAHHFGTKQFLVDTVKLNRMGSAVFTGSQPLAHGIYMIVLPGRSYFEILISEDQKFEVYTRYNDHIRSLKISGSTENSEFLDYQRTWSELQKSAGAINKRLQSNKQNPDSLRILTALQKSAEKKMVSYLNSVVTGHQGTLLAALVRSIIPVEMPVFKAPPGAQKPDSILWVMQYNYNKNHFFDNINLADERLLRTPILEPRLNAFFTNVVIQAPDSINKEIDKILKKTAGNKKVYQFIANYLFNHFRESQLMGHDAVIVKLADEIYLTEKADWVSKEFKDDLRKQVALIKPSLIGKKAQDLVMDSYKGIFVSLHDVEKEFTVLYFWEPDCGHCKEATPKLKAWYEKAKNDDIEIFAVCTTAEKDKWSKYIKDNELSWINGWDPERRTRFDFYFNVQSTPLIYILDRNKKIIAKKLGVEDIAPFIDNYRKYRSG